MTKRHDILWFESLDSTNDEAGRRISEIDNLSVVAAKVQTCGRGQGEHVWISPYGENLLFSLVLKFGEGAFPARDIPRINEWVSGAVVDFLRGYGIEAWVKLPNDIYVGSDKICGTLIENRLKDSWLISSIIGIGLNVNQTEFDSSLPNPTSMALETSKAYDIDACLDDLLTFLGDGLID